MSTAFAMDNTTRIDGYTRQNGSLHLTPAQLRRVTKKTGHTMAKREAAMQRHPAGKDITIETCKTCDVPIHSDQKCQTKNGTDAPKMHADRARKLEG